MACSSFRALLFWCREVLLVLFCQRQQQQRNGSSHLIYISHQFPQVFSSSRVSEVTLGTFSVRFCGLLILPCLAVLVPGGAFATLLSAAAAPAAAAAAAPAAAAAAGAAAAAATAAHVRGQGIRHLKTAAAAARPVLVPGGGFGTLQQRQQPSSISHQFSLISSLR